MSCCTLNLCTTLLQTSSRGVGVRLGETVPAGGQAFNKKENIKPSGWLLLSFKIFVVSFKNLERTSLCIIKAAT